MNVFEMTDYREFLLRWIEREKSDYLRFSKKHSKHFSYIALKRLLSRGRNKRDFLRNYKMSHDRFVELLYDLRPKLNEAEILHLTFIKIIQDTEKPETGSQSKLSKLLLKNISLISENPKTKIEHGLNAPKAIDLIQEGLKNLPTPARKRAEQKIFENLLTPLIRANDHPDVARIIKKIKEYKTD